MDPNLKFIQGIIFCFMLNPVFAQVKIGVFADCQYAPNEPSGTRFYRNSQQKLKECLSEFSVDRDISLIAGLGDLIDNGFASYAVVNELVRASRKKIYNVPGNHDYNVENEFVDRVDKTAGFKKHWFTVSKKEWMFVFLNGFEISIQSTDVEKVKMARNWIETLKKQNKPNCQEWNGALGKRQLNWLDRQLGKAEVQNKNVAIFCHFPLLPFDAHCLWDSDGAWAILENHPSVRIWINGHHHAGNFAEHNGIYFLNLKGMVETPDSNAFAKIGFGKENIVVEGFGREPDRVMNFQPYR